MFFGGTGGWLVGFAFNGPLRQFFFTMNPNLKYFLEGAGGGGARVSDFFFHFCFFGGGGVVDIWTVEQAQTNLPLQLLRSWGITMH